MIAFVLASLFQTTVPLQPEAVKVVLLPAQIVAVPLIVGTLGNGFIVTFTAAEVAGLHKLAPVPEQVYVTLKYRTIGVNVLLVNVLTKLNPPVCSVVKPLAALLDDCQVGTQVPNPPVVVAVSVRFVPAQSVRSLTSVIVICGSGTIVI